MSFIAIEQLMAVVSELFIFPVILAILAMFVYALFALGKFVSQSMMRRKTSLAYHRQIKAGQIKINSGHQLHNYYVQNPTATDDELEVFAIKHLETLRIVTRLSPMLGLIATMIPMGPALKSLADGNIQGISENLIIAFAAVIWGLMVSILTFWPATVKKRWFADEMINVRKIRTVNETATNEELKDAA